MEDAVFSSSTVLGAAPDLAMDFDYVDELLLEGCWLETTDGSEFLNPSPSNSNAFFDSSFIWHTSESSNGNLSNNPYQTREKEERQRLWLPGNSQANETHCGSSVNPQFSQNMADGVRNCNEFGDFVAEGSELSRRWWIGPRTNPGPTTSVMQRLIQALGYIRDFTKDKDVLIQLWVPVNRGGKRVLTTSDQPFTLDYNCRRLESYRNISVRYNFSAEENSKDIVGLPGRVFLGKVPEWTPDVRFFRSDEYPRVDHAQEFGVGGTLALPVFEHGNKTCLGVIEIVTTTQKIKYRPELETVCKALEAVNLTSSAASNPQTMKACNESYQAALPEIKEVLRCACETHKLPLAQTWVSCIQQGKGGCRHSNENYVNCVSTVDDACYMADPGIQGFHEACSEHHLLKGEGVAGGAFMTNQPCFSSDITSYKKTEYPLSHHARMFGLHGAVAIRLRCIHTGTADFVLEFFLPVGCMDPEEQRKMLNSLSVIIQQVCHSLRVVTDKELEGETCSPVSEVLVPSDGIPIREEMSRVPISQSEKYSQENSSWTTSLTEVQQNSNVSSILQKEKASAMLGKNLSDVRLHQEDFSLEGSVNFDGDPIFNEVSFSSMAMGKTGEKRRAKAEKTITVEVLRQYFAGSLKDAAKSIGVCPTTLKRICRQHGIKRWPSRKIKKVGHSLRKLQHVIDSVEGASGAFPIGSFYTNFPELASPKISGASPFSTAKLSDHPKSSSVQPEGGVFSPPAATSKSPSSSCSQSSSSGQCYSSGKQQLSTCNVGGCEDLMVVKNSCDDGVLKRVRSDAELHASNQEVPNLMPRSQSHKSLKEQPTSGHLLPSTRNIGQTAQEVDAQRVKVAYGDEIIRFRIPNQWRFKDLFQEISRRFNIDDMSRFDVKYLDDDSEWVLLTCDADLEECIDVCRSSQSQTIKLSLQVSQHHFDRSSRSRGPS